MSKRLGLGLVAAGMLAFAGSAQAVPYEGLAFNNLDTHYESCGWFCQVEVDTYRFTRLASDYNDFLDSSSHRLDDPVLGNIGQAVYDVSGGSIDASGGLNGGTISFSEATKTMTLEGHTAKITGGSLAIFSPTDPDPSVTLPFGFGTAEPDYALSGSMLIEIDGVEMEFMVCESFLCAWDQDDSRPFGDIQPYNTLNVGNLDTDGNQGDGSTDLSMFLFLATDQCTFDSGCGLVEGYWRYKNDSKHSHKSRKCRESEGAYSHKCNFKETDTVVWMKVALWGEGQSQDAPEPATLALFGAGLIGLGAVRRRRRLAA